MKIAPTPLRFFAPTPLRPYAPTPLRAALGGPGAFHLAQESLEKTHVAFLILQDSDHEVLRHVIHAITQLDDLIVVLDGALLGLDDAFDDVADVGLHVRRLEERLAG